MMTKEQKETVMTVWRKFESMDNLKSKTWTPMDEQMAMLEWLNDKELLTEAEVKLIEQRKGDPRCKSDHPSSECFVPTVLDAIEAITELHKTTDQGLHEKNRFILQYYLALSGLGAIRS